MSFQTFAVRGIAVLGFLSIAVAACDAEAAHGRRHRRACCYDPCCRPVVYEPACCETVVSVEPACTTCCDPCERCCRTVCGCRIVETVVVASVTVPPSAPTPAAASTAGATTGRSVLVETAATGGGRRR